MEGTAKICPFMTRRERTEAMNVIHCQKDKCALWKGDEKTGECVFMDVGWFKEMAIGLRSLADAVRAKTR